MKAEPQKEHQWLHQLIGEWTFEAECFMGPDQPMMKSSGKSSIRTLGGMWILNEGEGAMPGGGMSQSIITIGFDPARKRFVGSFVCSVMPSLWVYEGSLDSAQKVLTLDAEGPSFTDPTKLAKYQDIVEIVAPDHHTLSSQVLGEGGQWRRFMTAHYRRAK